MTDRDKIEYLTIRGWNEDGIETIMDNAIEMETELGRDLTIEEFIQLEEDYRDR